jgi:folate-binding protein YgfZ
MPTEILTATRPDPIRDGAAVVTLPGRGALSVCGPDAAELLHGLLTNDVKGLRPGEGCHAALLTPKGRMRADLVVLRTAPGELLLDCEPSLGAPLAAILAGYVPFSRSTLADRTAECAVVHVEGPGAPALLEAAGLPVPASPFAHAAAAAAGIALRVARVSRAGGAGFDFLVRPESAGALAAFLADRGATPVEPVDLERARIEAGIPRWGAELDETVLPNEAWLERTAISYTKGCYLGQETVARLKTYGHVNRHLVALLLAPESTVAPGAAVRSGDEVVGRVTSAVASERRGGGIALAYVKREHEAPGTRLDVETAGGAAPGVVAAVPLEG